MQLLCPHDCCKVRLLCRIRGAGVWGDKATSEMGSLPITDMTREELPTARVDMSGSDLQRSLPRTSRGHTHSTPLVGPRHHPRAERPSVEWGPLEALRALIQLELSQTTLIARESVHTALEPLSFDSRTLHCCGRLEELVDLRSDSRETRRAQLIGDEATDFFLAVIVPLEVTPS
jgi:hypothetical protein